MTVETPNADTSGSDATPGTVVPIFKEKDPAFMKKLQTRCEKITEIKLVRKEKNAEIKAVKAQMEQDGLNVDAVMAAMGFVEMNEEKQTNYDYSYNVTREALGMPVQGDLFQAAVESEMRDRQAKN